MKKRIMILFCAAVMSFCFLPCGAAEQTDTNADGWTKIAENSRLSLAVDLETSDFSVKLCLVQHAAHTERYVC